MKKRNLRNKYLLLVLLIISSTDIYSQEEDRKISELYINTADSFYNSSNFSRAEVFLNKSLLYYKDSSDAYYLKSLIEEKTGGNTESIINDLKKALILRNWNIYKEEDAFFRLGILYSSVKEYKKAVSTLYVIETEKIDNENYLEAYSNSLLNSGMFATASEILKTAIEKYPDNNNFKIKLINNDSDYYDSLLLNILENNDVFDYSPQIILEVLKNTEDEGVKRELFDKISIFSKEYPEIIIEKIKITKKAEEKDINDFFEYKGYENLKLIREIKKVLSSDFLKIFNNKLSGLNSIIYDDINNDGMNEIVFRVENGIPVWYREDYNQDGLNDIYIYYDNGNIETIEYGEKYLIKYINYPLLENIIISSDTIDVYDYSNRNTVFKSVDSSEMFMLPDIKNDFKKRVDKLLPKASVHEKNNPENKKRIMEYLKNSRIKMYSEITDGNTTAEGIIKDGNFTYINRNNNNGNSFETKEIYKNGKLSSIMYDGNSDGIFEMKIENNIKYWDYNEDGIYDSYEKRNGKETIKGYSSQNNGIYDVEEKSINGTIVSVRKDEKWFNVTYDKKNNIYWLGQSAENIKINNLKDNSYINNNNKQIHIFMIADKYYAEVIN